MRAGLNTFGAKNAITICIHTLSVKLEHRTAVELLVTLKTVLCPALTTDLSFLPSNLKWGEHRGNADKEGDGAEVEAKGPSLKKERYPYCSQSYHYDEAGSEAGTIRNPIAVVQKNERNKESQGKPQVLKPAGVLEIEPQIPLAFPP